MELTERWDHLCLACFQDTGGAQVCPNCGCKGEIQRPGFALPARTVLHGRYHRYLLGRVLKEPNEAEVSYAAFHTESRTRLTIREYFPRALGRRHDGSSVQPLSTEVPFFFGLKGFIEEARILQSLHHPHVISISDILEQNGTAYVLEAYCDGVSLADYLKQKGGKLPEAAVLSLFKAVLDAVGAIHEKGVLHLDIRPENVLITESFGPVLTGFAAYRIALAERMLCLPALAQSGYSPIEQYLNLRGMGPWSDVYSCAATLYQMLSGKLPPEAADRVEQDGLVPLDQLRPDVSAQVSLAVIRGLALDPRARPRNVQDFAVLLWQEGERSNQGIVTADSPLRARLEGGALRYAAKVALAAGMAASVLLAGYLAVTKHETSPQSGDAPAKVPQEVIENTVVSDGSETRQEEPLPSESTQVSPANGDASQVAAQTPKEIPPIHDSFSQELRRQADSGDRDARFRLGWVYENGKGVPKSNRKALKWYRLAAMQGLPEAQTALGRFNMTGKAVSRDRNKALQWFKRAAEQGSAEAQFALGILYELGLGVSMSKHAALNWYRAAAISGNATAQNRLGRIYDEGRGVPADDREAVKWYRLAAEEGDAEALYNLAVMYENGEGVPSDREAAIHWYRKADEVGHAGAKLKLKKLLSKR